MFCSSLCILHVFCSLVKLQVHWRGCRFHPQIPKVIQHLISQHPGTKPDSFPEFQHKSHKTYNKMCPIHGKTFLWSRGIEPGTSCYEGRTLYQLDHWWMSRNKHLNHIYHIHSWKTLIIKHIQHFISIHRQTTP